MMHDADKPMMVGIILLVSVLLGLLATGILGGSIFPYNPPGMYLKKIEVGGTPIRVEVANTKDAKIKGLSGRKSLPDNQGMLFIFKKSGKYPIWMRNMEFPIDVYWMDGRGIIIDKWENAQPSSYPQIYEPKNDAYYILEVVSGFSEVYNIEIGDKVTGL